MLAKELAAALLQYPDEEVRFRFERPGAEFEYFTIQRIAHTQGLTASGYPLKICFDLERQAIFREWDAMTDSERFERIEKALGFELHKWQREYIMVGRTKAPPGRGNGKTTAYILRYLLEDRKPLRIDDIVTDGEHYGARYRQIFVWEMKKIRGQLIEAGIPAREIIDRRTNTWRQDGVY